MTGSRRRTRAIFVFATLSLALVGNPVAVSADGAISHTGKYGVHYLVDSAENPGATCRYNAASNLVSIRVRWPHVEGYNHTSGSRDYQKVSWRFQVYRSSGMTGPLLYATTPLTFAHTYDNAAAYWPSRTYTFPTVAPEGDYTIRVQMYWYKPADTVVGIAIHHPDYHRHVWDQGPTLSDTCYWAH